MWARKSAPCTLNSVCATAQGNRSSGAGTVSGSTGSSRAAHRCRATMRRFTASSGWSCFHAATLRRCRSAWQAGAEQTRCRSPRRRSGRNHWRQMRHGVGRDIHRSSPTAAGTATFRAGTPGGPTRRTAYPTGAR